MRCVVTTVLLCLLSLPCFAGGWIELERPRRTIRRPAPPQTLPLEVRRHHVDVRAVDGWAEVRVDQTFRNPGPRVAEGTYFFPVPAGASVEEFRATLGDRELVGEVLEAEAARRIYRDLVRKLIDPAILEFYDRSLFKARVFPIPAGGDVRLQLSYRYRLPRSGDLYELSYPFESARFCRGGEQRDVRFEARLEDSTIASVHSPTHDIRVEESEGVWLVSYEAAKLRARKSLELEVLTARTGLAGGVRAFRPHGEDGYFVLRLAPGRVTSEPRPPANLVFVLDTSGSMAGEKIDHAKQALIAALRRLDRHDRFAILTFSSGVEAFEASPTVAEPEAVRRAIAFVKSRVARGGTHLAAALDHAVTSAHAFPNGATIVLSSDGAPTVGETRPREIVKQTSERNGGDHRLHVLGLGADVETLLLDDLARKNGGSRTYLASSRRLEAIVSSLLDKVLEPCLSDLRLTAPGLTLSGLEPEAPYDVFHGEDLVVTGRYRGRSHGSIEIRGRLGQEARVYVFDAEFPERGGDPVAAYLWAENRIDSLLEQLRGARGPEARGLRSQIVELGLRFGIVTPYTAAIVREGDGAIATELRRRVDQSPRARKAAEAAASGFAGSDKDDAFDYSRKLGAKKRAARSRGRTFALEENSAAEAAALGSVLGVTHASGRGFHQLDGRWVDGRIAAGKAAELPAPDLVLGYGSSEFFAELERHPELRPVFALGRSLLIRHGGRVIEVREVATPAKRWF